MKIALLTLLALLLAYSLVSAALPAAVVEAPSAVAAEGPRPAAARDTPPAPSLGEVFRHPQRRHHR